MSYLFKNHLVKIIGEDNIGNARGVHVSGLLRKGIILRGTENENVKKNDFFVCSTLKPSENVYFVNPSCWRKVKSKEERYRLDSNGEIKRIFYDSQKGDVVVTGAWNNIHEFADLKKVNRKKMGLLNADTPLMYVYSIFAEPVRVYETFNNLRGKMVIADFEGKLPGALNGERNTKLIMEILSGCYS